MNPLLSICIPTYNRCAILKDSILENLEYFEKNNIEVCISNNASTDGTKDFLDSLDENYKCIKIIHQNQNNGLEQNMIDAMVMASGDYLIPIGDDEVITVFYLPEILQILKRNPELVILNGLHGKKEHLENKLKNKTFNNPYTAFPLLWNTMPPGSIIVKKNILHSKAYEKYMGTSHAYTGWVWEYLHDTYKELKNVTIYTASQPIIIYKDEEKTWKNDAFKIMYYEIPLWFTLLNEHYKVIDDQNILKRYLKRMSRTSLLLSYKARGADIKAHLLHNLNYFTANQQKKAKVIAYIPKNMALLITHCIDNSKKIIKWIIRW